MFFLLQQDVFAPAIPLDVVLTREAMGVNTNIDNTLHKIIIQEI